MELSQRQEKNGVIVRVTEKLDVLTSPELETYLSDLIGRCEAHLVLDFSDLVYISSAGLRVILSTTKQLKSRGRELFLSGLKGAVEEVIQFSGFQTIINIVDTPDQALDHLA